MCVCNFRLPPKKSISRFGGNRRQGLRSGMRALRQVALFNLNFRVPKTIIDRFGAPDVRAGESRKVPQAWVSAVSIDYSGLGPCDTVPQFGPPPLHTSV